MNFLKFCIDCKHCDMIDKNDPDLYKCRRSHRVEMVSGRNVFLHCYAMREFGECGKDGKFWEARLGGTDARPE